MKADKQTERSVQRLVSTLGRWGKLAVDHENAFIDRFCKASNVMTVTEVSWNASSMKFTYIVECGQHVCDSAPIEAWIDFTKRFRRMKCANEVAERRP